MDFDLPSTSEILEPTPIPSADSDSLIEDLDSAIDITMEKPTYDNFVYILKCKQCVSDDQIRIQAKQKYVDEFGSYPSQITKTNANNVNSWQRTKPQSIQEMYKSNYNIDLYGSAVQPSSIKEVFSQSTRQSQYRKPNYSEQNKNKEIQKYPKWVDTAIKSENLLYVGWSNDIVKRINEHISGDGAVFTQLFPPSGIVKLYTFESSQEAKKMEPAVFSKLSSAMSAYCSIEFDEKKEYSFEGFITELRCGEPSKEIAVDDAYVYYL